MALHDVAVPRNAAFIVVCRRSSIRSGPIASSTEGPAYRADFPPSAVDGHDEQDGYTPLEDMMEEEKDRRDVSHVRTHFLLTGGSCHSKFLIVTGG